MLNFDFLYSVISKILFLFFIGLKKYYFLSGNFEIEYLVI